MISKKGLILGLAITSILTGCSVQPITVYPPSDYDPSMFKEVETSAEWLQLPQPGTTHVAHFGDSLVSTSRIFGNREIRVFEPIQFYPESKKAKEMVSICDANILPAGRYVAVSESPDALIYSLVAEDKKDILDTSSMMLQRIKCGNNSSYSMIGLMMDKQTEAVRPWLKRYWNPQGPILPKSKYKDEFVSVVTDDNFKQELYFNGRSGDTLKFMYREFSGSTLRSSFSQEVVYDLNDGNEIGFKDALIQVVNTSNTEIKYKVLRHFAPVK